MGSPASKIVKQGLRRFADHRRTFSILRGQGTGRPPLQQWFVSSIFISALWAFEWHWWQELAAVHSDYVLGTESLSLLSLRFALNFMAVALVVLSFQKLGLFLMWWAELPVALYFFIKWSAISPENFLILIGFLLFKMWLELTRKLGKTPIKARLWAIGITAGFYAISLYYVHSLLSESGLRTLFPH